MVSLIHILSTLLIIFYILTFTAYTWDFYKEESTVLSNSKRIFLFITICVHLLYILAHTIEFNHAPITNKFEIFTVLAFSTSFCYFLIELITDIRGTGSFIIFFSVIFQLISSIFITDSYEVQEVLRNRLLGVHVISALLGYAGFTVSAVYGVLFLSLYKRIKLNKFGLVFERLPSLETLEKMSFYALVCGFIMLTVAILIGFAWLPSAFPDISYLDPKLVSSGVVWVIYLLGIAAKVMGRWYGKKVIIFSITGFIIAIFSMMFVNIFASSFHTFY